MGVTLQQYRASIGLHNAVKIKSSQTTWDCHKYNSSTEWFDVFHNLIFSTSLSKFCFLFITINYIFDLIHECIRSNYFYINTKQDPGTKVMNSMGYHHQRMTIGNYRILLSCVMYCFIMGWRYLYFSTNCHKFHLKLFYRRLLPKKSFITCMINMLSLSLASMNVILICMSIPNIINPGPDDISSVNIL